MTDRSLLGPWVKRFLLEHLVGERHLSRNTQQSYRDTLVQLISFAARNCRKVAERLTCENLAADLVLEFLRNLENVRCCTVTTRNQRLAAIHALARFVGDRSPEHVAWCGQIHAVPFKRGDRNPLTYLEKEEMDALLDAPNQKTTLGQRDRALLLFLYNSGARASEAAAVTVEDLEQERTGHGVVKIHGKGRKTRFCPLWPKTMKELQPLMRQRGGSSGVFLNRYGQCLTRYGIHTLVKRYARSASFIVPSLRKKHVSPHTIRHTTATHLLRAGVDINTIRSWLGHVSIDTTIIYAETDLETKAKALEACDPGGGHRRKQRWRDDPNLMEFLRKL
jgi:integrase/recombinase XerD